MKQATLPNGKVLQFDDGMSEKEMQRAVRRELGLSDKNILEGLDALSEAFEKMPGQLKSSIDEVVKGQRDTLAPAIKALNRVMQDMASNAVIHNAQMLNSLYELKKLLGKSDHGALESIEEGLSEILRGITRALEKSDQGTAQAIEQAIKKATGPMSEIAKGLPTVLKEAISYSHDITDANLKASMKSVSAMNKTVNEMSATVNEIRDMYKQLNETLQGLLEGNTKRAFRHADGSWTLETIRKH
jgi:septation ring formation regulator EzrA